MGLKSYCFFVVFILFALADSDVKASEGPSDEDDEESNRNIDLISELDNYVNSEYQLLP